MNFSTLVTIGGYPNTFGDAPFAWVSRAELRTYAHHQLLRFDVPEQAVEEAICMAAKQLDSWKIAA